MYPNPHQGYNDAYAAQQQRMQQMAMMQQENQQRQELMMLQNLVASNPALITQMLQGIHGNQGYQGTNNLNNRPNNFSDQRFGGHHNQGFVNDRFGSNNNVNMADSRFGADARMQNHGVQPQDQNYDPNQNRFATAHQNRLPIKETRTMHVQEHQKEKVFNIIPKVIVLKGNDSLRLTTTTAPFSNEEIDFKFRTADIAGEPGLDSAVESAVTALAESGKTVVASDTVLMTKLTVDDLDNGLVSVLEKDSRTAYRELNKYMSEIKTRKQLASLNKLDAIITNRLNTFLAVNMTDGCRVDGFIEDYNSILKHARSFSDDMEDALIVFMDREISGLYNKLVDSGEQVEGEETTKEVEPPYIYTYVRTISVDRLCDEFGMLELGNDFCKLGKSNQAEHLRDLVLKCASDIKDGNVPGKIMIVTLDERVIECAYSIEGELYVRMVR